MNTQRSISRSNGPGFWPRQTVRMAVLGGLLMGGLGLAAPGHAQDQKDSSESGQDHDSIGFNLSKNAGAQDVGLPWYPGARRHKDNSDDSSSVQMGLWGGLAGFRLAVLKLESDDSQEKIAAFYRKALAKYGKVLNCTGAQSAADKKTHNSSNDPFDCSDDGPDKGGLVLKSGTKERQHLVAIQPDGSHSLFQLVYLEAHGDSKK
jgi:hypothetical protein